VPLDEPGLADLALADDPLDRREGRDRRLGVAATELEQPERGGRVGGRAQET